MYNRKESILFNFNVTNIEYNVTFRNQQNEIPVGVISRDESNDVTKHVVIPFRDTIALK